MGYSLKSSLDCNGECRSCYEATIRKKKKTPYDIDRILATLDRIIEEQKKLKDQGKRFADPPTIHGGEPLLMKFKDLERICSKIYGFWGYGGIQTNGLLLNDKILDLLAMNRIALGISLDGDTAQLNYGRWNQADRSFESIQQQTDKVLENIQKAFGEALQLSLIVVLRKYNASKGRIDGLIKFLQKMYLTYNIIHVRLNPGVVYNPAFRKEEELWPGEYGDALCKLHDFTLKFPELKYRPFIDIMDLMLGNYDQSCSFNQCDPFNTRAEMAINHNGEMTNCLHVGPAVVGMQIPKAEYRTERYDLLFRLDQEQGGCKDCKFWHLCYGGCPGAGEDNDWRNRTRFCGGYKSIFKKYERLLKSLIPNIHLPSEFFPIKPPAAAVQEALRSKRPSIHRNDAVTPIIPLKERLMKSQPAGDHADLHTDRHGDRPHGDHTDAGRKRQ